MSRIGVFGGMGPSATVDFLDKLVKLTPALRDQDHLPVIVASLPHIHDRSSAILGHGRDPLPQLLAGIQMLNQAGVGVIAIPCNSSHHWFDEMSNCSKAPLLHIGKTCVEAIPLVGDPRVAIFSTRGALKSGFYQRELLARGIDFLLPAADGGQTEVDSCIREIKAGNFEAGGLHLTRACVEVVQQGATLLILGCTEIPIASRYADVRGLALIDSSLELARASVSFALARGWNRPGWDS
ncbi:MAG: amino acid racemase [Polaromonas sp.]|uniref:aspartate/glutamate racemase family protein n=1 Tax=Polaromonas sp. TaxID=1869339 RepID=UPI0027318AD8|nr:amino acid racemase [Polaromonas sp.]MDP1741322.1 amino acid racemase [Polaromonas sp.]MDP1953329.1 amino acid racemase [Polaromonas sp.]MDP3355023.1 amino acid racemase [Polaromonas sp.]MDP3750797.1 amino acid racemase [Polaromonas sp.]